MGVMVEVEVQARRARPCAGPSHKQNECPEKLKKGLANVAQVEDESDKYVVFTTTGGLEVLCPRV